eukprot:jgi/Bigna1/139121/aug1.48_g13829
MDDGSKKEGEEAMEIDEDAKESPRASIRSSPQRNIALSILKNQFSRRRSGIANRRHLGSHECFVRRLLLDSELQPEHGGCVNTIRWNSQGNLLVSGSDDTCLHIYNPYAGGKKQLLARLQTSHTGNIFNAIFLHHSGDRKIASCAADGEVRVTDLEKGMVSKVAEHSGMAHKVANDLESGHMLFSCGEDGVLKSTDLRSTPMQGCRTLVKLEGEEGKTVGMMSLSMNPMNSYQIAVAARDEHTRVYDRRMLRRGSNSSTSSSSSGIGDFSKPMAIYTPTEFRRETEGGGGGEGGNRRRPYSPLFHGATSVAYSWDGLELLTSYHSGKIYLFHTHDDKSTEHARFY